jgi:hypothetical protein
MLQVLNPLEYKNLIDIIQEFDAKLAENDLNSVTLIVTGRRGKITGTEFQVHKAWNSKE